MLPDKGQTYEKGGGAYNMTENVSRRETMLHVRDERKGVTRRKTGLREERKCYEERNNVSGIKTM